MDEYVSNSYKSKEKDEKKKVEKVVTGKAVAKKKGGIQKFTDVFISEDISNVRSYILMDVLVPALKKAVADIVTNGIDMLLYGEAGHTKTRSTGSKIAYNSIYRDTRDPLPRRARNDFDYDRIIFNSRGDAEAVLNAMDEMISQYKVVTVGDLYDLADVTTNNYMINKYGWTDIRTADVVRVSDGYVIKLPKPMPLD